MNSIGQLQFRQAYQNERNKNRTITSMIGQNKWAKYLKRPNKMMNVEDKNDIG